MANLSEAQKDAFLKSYGMTPNEIVSAQPLTATTGLSAESIHVQNDGEQWFEIAKERKPLPEPYDRWKILEI